MSLADLPLFILIPAALWFGAALGGLATVVAWRLPRLLEAEAEGEDVRLLVALNGESLCDGCGRKLGWAEKLPLIGLFCRPACPGCGHRSGVLWPLAELSVALLALAALMIFGPTFKALAVFALGWGLAVLALIDARHWLLPDAITQPLAWGGLAAAAWVPGWPVTLGEALAGALIGYGFAAGLALAMNRGGQTRFAMGDVKLIAAAGAWMGAWNLPFLGIAAAILGAIPFLALRRFDKPLPFGPALAAATFLIFLLDPALRLAWR